MTRCSTTARINLASTDAVGSILEPLHRRQLAWVVMSNWSLEQILSPRSEPAYAGDIDVAF